MYISRITDWEEEFGGVGSSNAVKSRIYPGYSRIAPVGVRAPQAALPIAAPEIATQPTAAQPTARATVSTINTLDITPPETYATAATGGQVAADGYSALQASGVVVRQAETPMRLSVIKAAVSSTDIFVGCAVLGVGLFSALKFGSK